MRAAIAALAVLASLGLLAAGSAARAQQPWEPGQLPPEPEREPKALNVSIALFDPGVPEDISVQRDLEVFPGIRDIESLFLPFVLRRVMTDAGEWGVVRVIPATDPAAELLIEIAILASDGDMLALDVRAVDSTGRVWVQQAFSAETSADYAANDGRETGHAGLYEAIDAALVAVRDSLSARELESIVDTSLIRYAANLVPEAFGDYIDAQDGGIYKLVRLPARNDPMLGRIHRLRRVEYAITDAVDEKYEELHSEIASTYDLWREYRRKYRRYQAAEAERAEDEALDAPLASYESLMDRYLRYKWDRQAEQEQENWAEGFNNEVASTIERIGSRIDELKLWVDSEYATWERILSEFYELEQELAAPQS